jgi:HAD superfamily hydrolase (TIGR01509 family)
MKSKKEERNNLYMYKTIIWDLDGVLIESEPFLIKAEVEILPKFGIPLTEKISAEYLGYKLDDYLKALEKRFDKKVPYDDIRIQLHKKIVELYDKEIPLTPHAKETLETLKSNFVFALATSREKHLALRILKRLDIKKYFKQKVFKEEVSRGKPDPEVFLKAAAKLKIKPNQCAVVEDAESGFRAGKAAGMFVIARKAKHNQNQDFSLADEIVEDLREIVKLTAPSIPQPRQ